MPLASRVYTRSIFAKHMLSGSVFLCASYLHHMHLVCASVCYMHHIMIPANSNRFSCTLHRVVPLTHCLFRKRLSLQAYTILNLTNPAVRENQIQINCFLLSWWNFSQTTKLFKHPGSHRCPAIKAPQLLAIVQSETICPHSSMLYDHIQLLRIGFSIALSPRWLYSQCHACI